MVEIWTEDSGSGFQITKSIIECIYGKKYIKIIPHDGNGNDIPQMINGGKSRGGILYDLKFNRNNDNVIIILIDIV